ncbi:ATP-binding protein [Streptomyces sp. NPDC092307]|uniref:ATP-binding protein n=1 Tax=Streptomyces sp. NPDC092307 TaxID=3366013 RepID=UPI00381FC67D
MGTNTTTVDASRACGNRHPAPGPVLRAGTTEAARTSAPARTASRQGVVCVAAEKNMVSEVRRFASALLGSWGVAASDRESAVLIIGELGANAAQYGRAELAMRLSLEGTSLRIDVCDVDSPSAVRRSASATRPAGECGRGLAIVGLLADRVEITLSAGRHAVRADLRLTTPGTRGGM